MQYIQNVLPVFVIPSNQLISFHDLDLLLVEKYSIVLFLQASKSSERGEQ